MSDTAENSSSATARIVLGWALHGLLASAVLAVVIAIGVTVTLAISPAQERENALLGMRVVWNRIAH